MVKKALWSLLLFVAPDLYEKRKSRNLRIKFPEAFDTTESIFVHIPKAAGTSVAMALYGMQVGHWTWRQWRELNPVKFRKYFKFAIMRDPVDRFVSAFYYLRGGGMNASDKQFGDSILMAYPNANAFAKALVDYELQRKVLAWKHFRRQADYVADERGKPQTDAILLFENLDAEFASVAGRINPGVQSLPCLNKTAEKPDVGLDKDALDVLECLYRTDFTLWHEHATGRRSFTAV